MLPEALARRVVRAASTSFDAADGLLSLLLLAALAAVLLPAGFRSGFLRWDPVRLPPWRVSSLIAGAFVMPALAEELLFRVCLLPHPAEGAPAATLWGWGVFGVAAFVPYHPLKALALRAGSPKRRVFTDPAFLLMAALLGGTCTVAYLTGGSLWPPVLIHGIVVVVWLLLLGGHARLLGTGRSP